MMQPNTQNVFFALIRSELSGQALSESPVLCEEEIEQLLDVAKHHDLSNIVIDSVIRNSLIHDPQKIKAYQNTRYLDTGRVLKLDYEQKRIAATLESSRIPYVLLKGSIMRNLYPERWMRSSSDLDVLVHREDLEAAVHALKEKLQYSLTNERDMHAAILKTPTGVCLELHHSILAHTENINSELKNVWDHVAPMEGTAYGYEEKPYYFVFHHLAHMYFHLLRGGCGIRPFLDLWIIENRLDYEREKLDRLLANCDILLFSESVKKLIDCWMNGQKPGRTEKEFSEYIISGRLFGSRSNQIAAGKSYSGGFPGYIFRRLFISDELIFSMFPWAERHRILLPLAQIKRWFFLLDKRSFSRVKREVNILLTEEGKQKEVSALLKAIGVHH